jgi:uncharacterized membrane protein (UPF0136 family)
MVSTVLTFGLIAGALMSVMLAIAASLFDTIGFDRGQIVGYTSFVAAFLLVFFGIRSYRDRLNVALSFRRAFTIGIGITVVASLCYVATWQVIYYRFAPDFLDRYAAHQAEKSRKAGASEQEIESQRQEMASFKQMYDKPLFNAAFTFLEPLPIGLLVSLISAGVLRTRR